MKIRVSLNKLYKCSHTAIICNSTNTYRRVTVSPNQVIEYDSAFIDNTFVNNLKNYTSTDIMHTLENETIARENGIEYNLKSCVSCGGRVKRMETKPFIVEVL